MISEPQLCFPAHVRRPKLLLTVTQRLKYHAGVKRYSIFTQPRPAESTLIIKAVRSLYRVAIAALDERRFQADSFSVWHRGTAETISFRRPYPAAPAAIFPRPSRRRSVFGARRI